MQGRSVAEAPRGYVHPQAQGPRSTRGSRHAARGHAGHYAALVGAPGSGLGFYPLPYRYRLGAWRYHQRFGYVPYPSAIQSAVAADAVRTYGSFPADRGYRYGVFNPNDGVGTPFFAGYYGPAGGDDDAPAIFGHPYR
jgi:hypothetical protein